MPVQGNVCCAIATTAAESGDHIRGPADVFARMGARLRGIQQEEFHALLLNSRHRVIREVLVTRGILDSALGKFGDDARNPLIAQAQKILIDTGNPTIWLQTQNRFHAVDPRVRGIPPEDRLTAAITQGSGSTFMVVEAANLWLANA